MTIIKLKKYAGLLLWGNMWIVVYACFCGGFLLSPKQVNAAGTIDVNNHYADFYSVWTDTNIYTISWHNVGSPISFDDISTGAGSHIAGTGGHSYPDNSYSTFSVNLSAYWIDNNVTSISFTIGVGVASPLTYYKMLMKKNDGTGLIAIRYPFGMISAATTTGGFTTAINWELEEYDTGDNVADVCVEWSKDGTTSSVNCSGFYIPSNTTRTIQIPSTLEIGTIQAYPYQVNEDGDKLRRGDYVYFSVTGSLVVRSIYCADVCSDSALGCQFTNYTWKFMCYIFIPESDLQTLMYPVTNIVTTIPPFSFIYRFETALENSVTSTGYTLHIKNVFGGGEITLYFDLASRNEAAQVFSMVRSVTDKIVYFFFSLSIAYIAYRAAKRALIGR